MLIQRSNQMAVLDSEQLLNERMLALKRHLQPSANGITIRPTQRCKPFRSYEARGSQSFRPPRPAVGRR
jgi:hypothetical protein